MNINTPYITDKIQLSLLSKQNHGRMRYTLMNDFLSKYSLQTDLYALRGFLAALLRIDVDSITSITVCNPIEPGNDITEKECILDLKLVINNNKIINVEIQSRFQDFWPERSITYLCRTFDQLKSGDGYVEVKPCVHIGILSHDLFKPDDPRYTGNFYSEYRLLNTSTHTEYSSKFEIKVISLNHLEDATDEDKESPNGLYHWAKLFTASSWEDLKNQAKENPMMSSLVGTVMQLSAEEKIAQACEARRRYSNDIATYEAEIAQKVAAIADLDATLADKDAALADKDAALADKDATIKKLQAELEALKKESR